VFVAAATEPPAHDVIEIAGPEVFAFDDAVARVLGARGDHRPVVADPDARYFGARVAQGALLPGAETHLGSQRLADWLSRRRESSVAAV
jgi:uncharacterized protein YbjT (DUF2867 family)